MSDARHFSVSLEEHGRHECAATIMMGLLYPEWDEPDVTLDAIYESLCGYLLRVTSERGDGWAEDRQLMRPIHAFVSSQRIERVQRDIATRLPKALWTGFVARELVLGVRSFGNPDAPPRKAAAPIAEEMAGYLKMSASNLKARAWRPWARSAHLCIAFAHLHLLGTREGESRFELAKFLVDSDCSPLVFANLASSWEEAVAEHRKIPTTREQLLRIRVTEKRIINGVGDDLV